MVKLTEIETKVLVCLCEDLTSEQIGVKVFRAKRTVDDIRKSLRLKTGVKGLAGLVKYAIKHNIIELN